MFVRVFTIIADIVIEVIVVASSLIFDIVLVNYLLYKNLNPLTATLLEIGEFFIEFRYFKLEEDLLTYLLIKTRKMVFKIKK